MDANGALRARVHERAVMGYQQTNTRELVPTAKAHGKVARVSW